MNTKNYKRLFAEVYEKGEIDKELYDLLLGEIEVDGKMTKRIYKLYLEELERRRAFDVDGTPFDTRNSAKTDGTYVYMRPKRPFWHFWHAVSATIFKFIGWFGSGVGYGVWRIKDRKKLKKLKHKPFITVSNHVGYIDAVLTRREMGCKKQYIVAAPHNCKNTFGGRVLKSATMIPLPITLSGTKLFNERLEYVRDRNAAIHFYAEKAMWVRYRKPRPYKDGAFVYADKLDVPVVPMLYCFKRARGLRRLFGLAKAVVRIADPIFADKSLPMRERRADLAERSAKAVRELYEDFYGIPLEYLPEREKIGAAAERTKDAEAAADGTADADVAENVGTEITRESPDVNKTEEKLS